MLEDEYDRIRRPPSREDAPSQEGPLDPGSQSAPPDDTLMVDSNLDQDLDEDAPKSRGSEAVERRIEKVISELKESGAVELMNEREFESRKVKFHLLSIAARFPPSPLIPHIPRLRYTPLDQETVELTFFCSPYYSYRMPLHWTCTFHTFEQHLTHAFTARLLPIMSKNCKENV